MISILIDLGIFLLGLAVGIPLTVFLVNWAFITGGWR